MATASLEEKDSITIKEFFATSFWSLKTVWKMAPTLTSIYIFSDIALAIMSFVSSFLLAKVIDILISISQSELTFDWVYFSVAIFFVNGLLQHIFRLLRDYSQRMLNMYIFPKFQEYMYVHMNKLGIETLEQPDINNLISRVQQNWRNLHMNFEIIVGSMSSIVAIVTGGLIVFNFMPSIIPFLILVIIPYVYYDRKYTKLIWRKDKEFTERRRGAYDSMWYLTDSKTLQELTITGGRNLLEKQFVSYREIWHKFVGRERARFFRQLFILRILRDGVLAFADYTVIIRFLRGMISIGDVTFYFRVIAGFSSDTQKLSSSLTSLYEGSLRVSEVKAFFELEAINEDGNKNIGFLTKGPEIEFVDVDFKYPNTEKYVIKNLNLHIKSGEKVAIVGHNGAGKTTLVKLISGFYKVDNGAVLINGININDIKKESLYKNMAVLFQEFNKYDHLSAKQNIYIGKTGKKVNMAKVKEAAKKADADDFIEDFDAKYDQILSEKYKGGVRPSTGMWQKIAIARFFYRNSPLVIFDEPTAAIDAESESRIFNKIYNFFKNKTVLIISHRFSTVRNADRIIVFEKGKIIEEGSHHDLMKLKGKYYDAFTLQAKGYN